MSARKDGRRKKNDYENERERVGPRKKNTGDGVGGQKRQRMDVM